MATEIEYKFLIDEKKWAEIPKPEPQLIVQGFLSKSEQLVVRVRIIGNKGMLTIKGKTKGISRTEFEYEIPVSDAEELISEFTDKHIRKLRYVIHERGHDWEIDVFEGKLAGLILAELEVNSEDEQFEKPDWVGQDVSTDPNYYNAVLIDRC
jgi:CYTH domain-containing protein